MIQSVDRAVAVLLELQGARRLRLTELASRLSLPNSTVHGIVATLVARGMVEQDPSGRYALGPGVLRLSNVYLDSNELRLRALTWTDALAERSGCAVRVGVPLEREVVVIHHVFRPDGSHQMREIGIDIPAHGTALGKAMLAFDPSRAQRLFTAAPLPSSPAAPASTPMTSRRNSNAFARTGSPWPPMRPSWASPRWQPRSSMPTAR